MALMDYLRPQWKHSNPDHRAAALRSLEEDRQEVFLSVALEDPDPLLRAQAAKRVSEEKSLRRLLEKSPEKNVQDIGRKALYQALAEKIKAIESATDEDLRVWMQELRSDPKVLEDLARNARSAAARRLAAAGLTHASALLSVALQEEEIGIALAALEKLTRDAHLQSVAKGARCREAREAAKQRLQALEAAKQPDVSAVHRAKLQVLFSLAEKSDDASVAPGPAFNWDAARERLEEAEKALRELTAAGAQPAGDALVRFRDQVAAFRARDARHVAAAAAATAQERQAQRNRETKEALCARMEALHAGSEAVDEAEVEKLADQFAVAGPAAEEDVLRARFRAAKDKVFKEKLQRRREQEEAARQQAQAATLRTLLEELAQRAEGLRQKISEGADAAAIAAQLEPLRREWRRALASPVSLEGKEALGQRLEEIFSAADHFLAQARQNAWSELAAWAAEVESLSEVADLQAAEKRAREIHGLWKARWALAQGLQAETLALRYREAADRLRETLDWHRWSNLRRKQDICAQMETLLPSEDRKAMVARFKELLAEWKSVGQVPWDSTEATWDRYHTACDALYEKCREYFAELDEERESNAKAKEDICAKLEAILTLPEVDWREATETFREAQSNWKALGAAPREKSEALWSRFRAACQTFYARKDQYYQENLARKTGLAEKVEALRTSVDWKATAAQIKDAQEQWKTIGPAPRDQAEALWQRFHGVCEAFFQARREHFEKLEQERPANLRKKIALCEQIENLEALPEDAARFQAIREAQAQWKEIGAGPQEQEDAVWERFRKPIDAYFETRKQRQEPERLQREENAKLKEDLCAEAESLRDSTEWKTAVEKIKSLQARWKVTGPAPRQLDSELWRRFRSACDAFFDRLKEYGSQRDQEREGNLRKKEGLCYAVEILSGRPAGDAEKAAREEWLRAREAEGLAMPMPEPSGDWQQDADQVKALQLEWRKIGPVARDRNDAIWERFLRACDVFFEERRRAMGLPADDPQANLESKLALIAAAERLALDPGARHEDAIRDIRRDWKKIGPVPRAQSDYVWDRFNAACDAALGPT